MPAAARAVAHAVESSLGANAGVTHNTARAWLSVLEASFICFRVPAWHRIVRKQLVRAAKLHFIDSGLACHLLGIVEPAQLQHHPLRGAIFESWVVAEIYRWRAHRGLDPALLHFRAAHGLEADLAVETGVATILVEAKSAGTVPGDAIAALSPVARTTREVEPWRTVTTRVVYGGEWAHH